VESVEPAGIGNELWPLRLKHLPNRLVRKLGVLVGLGVGVHLKIFLQKSLLQKGYPLSGAETVFAAQQGTTDRQTPIAAG
jgi:hypothetical protein